MSSESEKRNEVLKYLEENVFKYDLQYAVKHKDSSVKKAILDIQEDLRNLKTSKQIINYVNFLTEKGTSKSRAFSENLKSKGIPRVEDVIDEFNMLFKDEN